MSELQNQTDQILKVLDELDAGNTLILIGLGIIVVLLVVLIVRTWSAMTLNPSQQRAVELDAPQIVVMSGPGSGKTRVAVERVKRLRGKVVILTFTNAAAHEFRERIAPRVPTLSTLFEPIAPEFCGTLHSYCFRLIRAYGHIIGYGHGVPSCRRRQQTVLAKLRSGSVTGVPER